MSGLLASGFDSQSFAAHLLCRLTCVIMTEKKIHRSMRATVELMCAELKDKCKVCIHMRL